MGAIMGGLGLLSGISGSRSQKRNERDTRSRYETQASTGINELNAAAQGYRDNPLLQMIMQQYMSRMGGGGGGGIGPNGESYGGGSMGPYDVSGLFGQASQGVSDLFDGQYGLSDPNVQNQIINQTVDQQLVPAYQQQAQNQEAQFSARGIGRSGLAQNAAQNRDYQFSRDSANVGREVRTQGALQAMNDQLSKIGAAQSLFGIGEGMNLQNLQQGAGFGMGMQGAEGDLARAIAQIRMQLAGLYAGQPTTSVGQDFAQNTARMAPLFGQASQRFRF